MALGISTANLSFERLFSRCLECGKVSRDKLTSMRHCEGHLNVLHGCSKCDYKVKTRDTLVKHYSRVHGVVRVRHLSYAL